MFKALIRKICSVVVIAYFVILFGNKIAEEIIVFSKKAGMIHYGIIIRGYEGLSILFAIGFIVAGLLVIKLVLWVTEDDQQEAVDERKEEIVE